MDKVLFFVQLPPPIHGAAICNQTIVDSAVISEEIEVRVLPIKFSNSITEMQRNGVRKLLKMFPMMLKLTYELVFNRPKLVYFTISPLGFSFLRDTLFVAIIKIFGIKVLYHLHGKGIADQKSHFRKYLYKFVFKNTHIICLSKKLAKDIEVVKGNAVVSICPNGVDKEEFGNPLVTNVIELLFLSNLLPSKGLYEFLEMAKNLIEEGYDVNVNLAGPFNDKFKEGDLDVFLNQNPKLIDQFVYHGPVSGIKKWALLERADILVHPTLNDAFPLVILEAMASGCAIVSTEQGGIPDILEGNAFGLIVPVGDSVRLFDSVVEMISNPGYLKLCQKNAKEEYQEKYTMEMFEKNIASILKKASAES